LTYQSNPSAGNPFTEENKANIIRRCASLGRYVEETIVSLTVEDIENEFNENQEIEPLIIFDVLNS
jgi:hypothetical protein